MPAHITEPWIPGHLQVRQIDGVCAAHEGVVGTSSACTVYANRPGPCRSFTASWEDGEPNESCDRARAQFGLPPLPQGWTD